MPKRRSRTSPSGRSGRSPRRLIDTHGPDPGTPPEHTRLTVGTIVGVHGLKGEVKLRLATDDPEHLATVKRVYVGDEARPRRLVGIRFHAGQGLLRLEGVSTPEAGLDLRGEPVRIAGSDARPLQPGEFLLYQLIGLEAIDEAGVLLGQVTDLMETGAHDVLVVTPSEGGPDLLFPNHPDVVLEILPDEGRMTVRPLAYDD